MGNLYAPQSVGITQSNLQNGGWYNGRQYWNGQVGDPGVIVNPTQQGSGQAVSAEVNAQSATAQGKTPQQFQTYLQEQTQQQTAQPTGQTAPNLPGQPGFNAGAGGGGGGGAGVGFTAPPPIDLPGIYKNLSDQAGLSDLEKSISDKTQSFNSAQSKINDNPFLSEADRVGRIQKLQNDFNNDIANDNNTLAMKKADIQTQIDIQTKQFDINSTAAKQALDTFTTLLQSGALNNASGQDIANITSATGLSSQTIMSAVDAQKAKNVQTSVIQYDDGTNQGFAVINSQTGEIISKQVVSNSKPTKGNSTTSNNQNILEQFNSDTTSIQGQKINGTYVGQFPQLVMQYASSMSLQDIYKAYANSPLGKKYGTPTESSQDIKQIYDYYAGKPPKQNGLNY